MLGDCNKFFRICSTVCAKSCQGQRSERDVKGSKEILPRKVTCPSWKMLVGWLLSFWNGPFLGAFVSFRRCTSSTPSSSPIRKLLLPWEALDDFLRSLRIAFRSSVCFPMSVTLHVPLKETCGHHLQTSWCKVTLWQGHGDVNQWNEI